MKRFCIWAGILASLLGPANAAGTVPGFSLTPQFDLQGKIMPGCKMYVIAAGTTQTPQNSYQDSALTLPQPNPLVCDATGRLPQFFVADGTIKLRLTNANGSQQVFTGDNLLVVGASSGGGGGGTVDPTTIMATGDLKPRYGTGVLTGFVRANGRTIGSSTSGATERANADTQALFEYLWNTDSALVVSTGRGASANADWVANKTITLPDWSGQALGGLDDMGAGPRGKLTTAYFGVDPTVLGASATAAQFFTLLQGNLPNVNFTFNPNTHVHTVNETQVTGTGQTQGGGPGVGPIAITSIGQVPVNTQPASATGTINSGGSSTPVGRISNLKLATIYIKM